MWQINSCNHRRMELSHQITQKVVSPQSPQCVWVHTETHGPSHTRSLCGMRQMRLQLELSSPSAASVWAKKRAAKKTRYSKIATQETPDQSYASEKERLGVHVWNVNQVFHTVSHCLSCENKRKTKGTMPPPLFTQQRLCKRNGVFDSNGGTNLEVKF